MDLLNREQWLAMAQCGQMRDAEPHLGELLTDRQFDNRDVCEAFVIGYIRNHRPAVARTLLDPWIADHPNDATPLLLRARILRLTGLPKESEQDFLAAIKMKPHWTEPRLELAELLIDRKRFDDAREYFQELMTDDAFYVRVRIGLAECLAAEGNSEQAEQVLQQASRFDPKSVHAWQALGRTLLENGKYKDAIQALEKALELRPHDDETNYLAGQAFSLNGQRDQADQYFQNVETARAALAELDRLNAELLVEANDPQKLIRAGEIMLRYGDPTEGVLLIHSGLDINPGDIKGLRLLAEHYASRAAEDFQYQTLADDFEQKLQDAEKSAE